MAAGGFFLVCFFVSKLTFLTDFFFDVTDLFFLSTDLSLNLLSLESFLGPISLPVCAVFLELTLFDLDLMKYLLEVSRVFLLNDSCDPPRAFPVSESAELSEVIMVNRAILSFLSRSLEEE